MVAVPPGAAELQGHSQAGSQHHCPVKLWSRAGCQLSWTDGHSHVQSARHFIGFYDRQMVPESVFKAHTLHGLRTAPWVLPGLGVEQGTGPAGLSPALVAATQGWRSSFSLLPSPQQPHVAPQRAGSPVCGTAGWPQGHGDESHESLGCGGTSSPQRPRGMDDGGSSG